MARNKSPRKCKPGKSGQPSAPSHISRPVYQKRFLISSSPEKDEDAPPVVNIICGFEATTTGNSEAIIEHMPADEFLVAIELGLMPVSFSP